MDNQQQPNPGQQVKRAKIILWLGIIIIIVVGLAVAVYFIFVKSPEKGNVNVVKNVNTVTNINKININVDTSDWQTVEYNYEPHVFSLRLPSNWQVDTQSAVAERQPMVSAYYGFDDGAVSFYVSYYNNTQSLKSWVDEHLEELKKSHEVISYQDSDYSHNDFTIVAGDVKETFRHLHAYYSYGSYVYELRFELELDDYSSLKNILQSIISTFQFTK